jgi:predicted amidohydrolase
MKTVRIAAAQTVEFREDIEAALNCVADFAARAESEGASLLCFPEGFLQGYLTDERPARRNALDLTSPAFEAVLNKLPKTKLMIVMGLIEVEEARLFNTAVVVDRGVLVGRYRKAHLLSGEHIFDAGSHSHVFEAGESGEKIMRRLGLRGSRRPRRRLCGGGGWNPFPGPFGSG